MHDYIFACLYIQYIRRNLAEVYLLTSAAHDDSAKLMPVVVNKPQRQLCGETLGLNTRYIQVCVYDTGRFLKHLEFAPLHQILPFCVVFMQ